MSLRGLELVSKGDIIYSLESEDEVYTLRIETFEDEYNQRFIHECCFMDGLEFLDAVKEGMFIDYDGFISEIIVDGYVSNLGLAEAGLCSGKFLIGANLFEEICKEHEVIVNWANK